MDETALLECPYCGEEEQQVLRAAASGWTLRCTACGHVHTAPAPPQERTVRLPVVLAEGAASRTVHVEAPLDGPVSVGDEFQAEGHRILVTALDRQDGARSESSPGRELRALYAKVFDTVQLRLTLNEGETTRSFILDVSPEHVVAVGDVLEVEGLRLKVVNLLSEDLRTLRRGSLEAHRIRRAVVQEARRRAPFRRGPPGRGKPPARRA